MRGKGVRREDRWAGVVSELARLIAVQPQSVAAVIAVPEVVSDAPPPAATAPIETEGELALRAAGHPEQALQYRALFTSLQERHMQKEMIAHQHHLLAGYHGAFALGESGGGGVVGPPF